MNATLKSIAFFIILFSFLGNLEAESNPHIFIDSQAQSMVSIITSNQDLYQKNPELFKEKIDLFYNLSDNEFSEFSKNALNYYKEMNNFEKVTADNVKLFKI